MHDPSQDFGEVFFALCKQVNTPSSLAAYLAWKYKSFTSLQAPRPENYCAAYDFSRDYLAYSWASKARVNLEGRDLKAYALEGFKADESFNTATTARIREWNLRGASPRVEGLIHQIKRKIGSILGPMRLSAVMNGCRLGNGATATLSRRRSRCDQKLTTLPLSVSPAALGLGRAIVESDIHILRALIGSDVDGPCSLLPCCFEVVDYNVFDTVPKSLKTDRTIAKEPTLNGFLQQGVHVYLRKRLQRAGVNLRDQTINQHWASLAEQLGLATLDAESASNSVTTALVALLLPDDWFWLLDLLRSRNTRLPDGSIHRNMMFSSMGNAYTFELESLLFFSILTCVCEPGQIVSVYGDDMIIPQDKAGDCIDALELFGFRINRSKSFVSGRFFESCGKHYWGSTDVTPVYQKKNPLQNRFERIAAHNRLIRWSLRSGYGVCLDSLTRNACALLLRGHERFKGPIGPESDSFFQVPFGEYRILHGFARVDCWKILPKRRQTQQAGAYAYWHLLKSDARPPSQEGRTVLPSPARLFEPSLYKDVFDAEGLTLSEFQSGKSYGRRKESIHIECIQVGVTWS